MRGLLLVGLLIVTLIIGILMIKNIESGPSGAKKTEAINRAKEAAKVSEDVAKRVRDITGKPGLAIPDTP
ncbi:MAG: hypothetical protein GXP53_00520 [Deltaproteobacteria bacterium]|nr:hypothetical protein [Deltaproteobacteria bacterium]